MSSIRKVGSFRKSYIPINQLSALNHYGSSAIDGVNKVDRIFPLYNDMPQLNKYDDEAPAAKPEPQKISELSNQGYVISANGFNTVTLHIEQYEQMRKSQENLEKLGEKMKEMIQFRQNSSKGSYDISVNVEQVKQYVIEQLKESGRDAWSIDESNIMLK